ncbi:NAD-dependent epimerase/dehydratase family protein, partial [Bacteroidota bacterium]
MEKILVTGATGYIGTKIVLQLADSGYFVHALYRSLSKTSDLKHPNIRLFEGDILNVQKLEKAMESCTGVFHIAAFAKASSIDKDIFYRVNYTGTLNVLDTALKYNIKKVIFTSTAGVYGPSTSEIINEQTKRTVEFFFEYEKTKWLAEEKIKEYVQKGLNVIVVNPTRVYGPGLISESNALTKMIKSYYEGKWHTIPGDGNTIANYVFIEDVVNGHINAYLKGIAGEKYILGGENISYITFFKTIQEVSGKNYFLVKIPRLLMLFFAQILKIVSLFSGKPPLITPALVNKF